jgi:hypothetical protein
VLYQLSYSHRPCDYSNCDSELSDRKTTPEEDNRKLAREDSGGGGGLHPGDDKPKYESQYRRAERLALPAPYADVLKS